MQSRVGEGVGKEGGSVLARRVRPSWRLGVDVGVGGRRVIEEDAGEVFAGHPVAARRVEGNAALARAHARRGGPILSTEVACVGHLKRNCYGLQLLQF